MVQTRLQRVTAEQEEGSRNNIMPSTISLERAIFGSWSPLLPAHTTCRYKQCQQCFMSWQNAIRWLLRSGYISNLLTWRLQCCLSSSSSTAGLLCLDFSGCHLVTLFTSTWTYASRSEDRFSSSSMILSSLSLHQQSSALPCSLFRQWEEVLHVMFCRNKHHQDYW